MKITQSVGFIDSLSVKQPSWPGQGSIAELTVITKVMVGNAHAMLHPLDHVEHAKHTIALTTKELYMAEQFMYQKPQHQHTVRLTLEYNWDESPVCTCPQVHNASCALGRQQGLHTLFQKG